MKLPMLIMLAGLMMTITASAKVDLVTLPTRDTVQNNLSFVILFNLLNQWTIRHP